MPEYFEVACLISKKEDSQTIKILQEKCGINLGENRVHKKVLLFEKFEYDNKNYIEHVFSIEYPFFKRDKLLEELQELQKYIDKYLVWNKDCDYVVCCYELTYNKLENINNYSDLTEEVFEKFPIFFVRKIKTLDISLTPIIESNESYGYFNDESQDIFSIFT